MRLEAMAIAVRGLGSPVRYGQQGRNVLQEVVVVPESGNYPIIGRRLRYVDTPICGQGGLHYEGLPHRIEGRRIGAAPHVVPKVMPGQRLHAPTKDGLTTATAGRGDAQGLQPTAHEVVVQQRAEAVGHLSSGGQQGALAVKSGSRKVERLLAEGGQSRRGQARRMHVPLRMQAVWWVPTRAVTPSRRRHR